MEGESWKLQLNDEEEAVKLLSEVELWTLGIREEPVLAVFTILSQVLFC